VAPNVVTWVEFAMFDLLDQLRSLASEPVYAPSGTFQISCAQVAGYRLASFHSLCAFSILLDEAEVCTVTVLFCLA
jgi:hypothetical protein